MIDWEYARDVLSLSQWWRVGVRNRNENEVIPGLKVSTLCLTDRAYYRSSAAASESERTEQPPPWHAACVVAVSDRGSWGKAGFKRETTANAAEPWVRGFSFAEMRNDTLPNMCFGFSNDEVYCPMVNENGKCFSKTLNPNDKHTFPFEIVFNSFVCINLLNDLQLHSHFNYRNDIN